MVGTNIIVVISDEVYEHMVFDGKPHQSVARFKNLASQSIIVSSLSENTISLRGWKIGYVAAPVNHTIEFRKVHQFLVFCVGQFFSASIEGVFEKDES